MENKDHKDIDFIASRYRDGLFRTENALNRIRPRRRRGWTPLHTAAAIAAGLVLTATAALVVHHNYGIESRERMESGINVTDDPDEIVVRVIDFEDAPLTQVVAEIRIVYGVEVTNMPGNPEDYRLSLHYEGTAEELVGTINEILETDLQIRDL